MAKKNTSLKEQAYIDIRDAIIEKRIRRDRIYSEQWFADSFSVSRTPVREALLQLRSEGIIDVLPNRGMIIKNQTLEDAKQIYQMRAAIEGYCAAYLANHHQEPEAIRILDEIEASMTRCRENFNLDDELNIHVQTIAFAGNPMFEEEFRRMRVRIELFWHDVIALTNRAEEAHMEHVRILEAMRRGDAFGAYQASLNHSQVTLQRICEKGELAAPAELKPIE